MHKGFLVTFLDGMGRFLTTRPNRLHLPPNSPNANSNLTLLSKKHQCLSLLQACSSMDDLRQIHAQIETSGLRHDSFLTSEILRFCSLSPSGSLDYARSLLAWAPDPTRSSWNHVIRGYSHSDSPRESTSIFVEMRGRGLRPNELTYPFVLKAAAHLSDLNLGKQVHTDALKNGVDSVVYVQNTLMRLYGSCHKFHDAKKVFDVMSVRTVVSWNTILSACIENSLPEESIGLFVQMRSFRFEPDQTTMVALLSASAELGCLGVGRWVHSQIIGKGLIVNVNLGTALVNMYAKTGAIGSAIHVFERMSEKNVWTWSAMILGFAQHGFAKEALELFTGMKSSPIAPNHVTFLGVLCACSHAGLVNDGYRIFHEMVHVHGIEPVRTHYSAMVDVLCRKGCLHEALGFIRSMPIDPDTVVWRTLLSACHAQNAIDSVGIREIVRTKLLALEPRRSGNYVMVANMYSEVGSWKEAAEVRRMMREEGLKKMAGESCVEVSGSIYQFVSGDESCVDRDRIHRLLDGLNLNMQKVGQMDVD